MMRITIETGGRLIPRRYLVRLLPLTLILWPTGNAIADYATAGLVPDASSATTAAPSYLRKGDTVAGYKVTSGYNLARPHPTDGTIQPHYGVDIATPEGTQLLAPASIRVACWWDREGGGLVAEVSGTHSGESLYKLLHLRFCTPGNYQQGQTFALSGSTGKGTGAHLDLRRSDRAEPSREDVEPFLTGRPAVPSLSNRELVCAIGAAEGTRNDDCSPNEHYSGHIDPGNGAHNLGSFSYQHGASSPEEADEKQLARLRSAERNIQAQAEVKFDRPLSKDALAAALDLWNQAPKAGNDFVAHLPSATPTTEQIIEARSRSYVDPQTGKLDAPGLGDEKAVREDQARRTGEVEQTLQQRRLKQLNN